MRSYPSPLPPGPDATYPQPGRVGEGAGGVRILLEAAPLEALLQPLQPRPPAEPV